MIASSSVTFASKSVQTAAAPHFAFDPQDTGPLRGFSDVTTAYRVLGLRS
jgi:hypothetical protein